MGGRVGREQGSRGKGQEGFGRESQNNISHKCHTVLILYTLL